MATEPTLEPTVAGKEKQEEIEEGEDYSDDVYGSEDDEEDNLYQSEDEEDEGDESDEGDVKPENMTALLLGKQNGTIDPYKDEDDEDEEYQEDAKGTAEDPIIIAGSKRGVDELGGDGEADNKTDLKKVRV